MAEMVYLKIYLYHFIQDTNKNVRTEIKNNEDNLLFDFNDDEKRNALYTDDYNFRLVLVDKKKYQYNVKHHFVLFLKIIILIQKCMEFTMIMFMLIV